MSAWGVLLLLVPAVIIAIARNEARRSRERAATVTLQVTAGGVQRELADGRQEGVAWQDVEVVEVLRASMGPHKATGGVVVLGAGPEQGCLVPIDRIGESGLVEALSRLPGFDLRAFTAALESRPPSRTVVWRSPDAAES